MNMISRLILNPVGNGTDVLVIVGATGVNDNQVNIEEVNLSCGDGFNKIIITLPSII